MSHLIIYAHPNAASFSRAVVETLSQELKNQGQEVAIRDLYSLGFNPVLSASDFQSYQAGQIPVDIIAEQEAIRQAEYIYFVYPTWWLGFPAILKGWIDRVFSHGFAFEVGEGGVKGLLTGKKAYIFQSVGSPQELYANIGFEKALSDVTDLGIFKFAGIEVLKHHFFWAVPYVDDATRKTYLSEIKNILA